MRPARRADGPRRRAGVHRRRTSALVAAAAATAGRAELRSAARSRLPARPHRCVHSQGAEARRPATRARGRPADARAAAVFRSHRLAADAGTGRGVCDTIPRPTPTSGWSIALLASPQYGERWGQHWLDVVRFAESEGFEYDRHRSGAWRYRDYVIDSFNADKPYDRFLREQLAGDELDPLDQTLQVAAGFHRLGPVRRNAGNQNVTSSRNEVLTEMTDAIGSALLGLTVGCARCHDHMFDPIRHTDYYRLQAFLASAHEHDVPLASSEETARWQAETDKAMAEIKALKDKIVELGGQADEAMAARLQEAQRRLPPPLPTVLSIKNDPAAAHRDPRAVARRSGEARPDRRSARAGSAAGRRRGRAAGRDAAAAYGAGPLDHVARSSADSPRAGQPRVAVPLWPRAGRHAQRFRRQRPGAQPSGTARLAGEFAGRRRLAAEAAAQGDAVVEHVSAGFECGV